MTGKIQKLRRWKSRKRCFCWFTSFVSYYLVTMQASFETQTIKWAFNSPRDELTTQLQQQLQTCVSPALVSEMFHADFQHHLKAIGMLLQVRRREISNLEVKIKQTSQPCVWSLVTGDYWSFRSTSLSTEEDSSVGPARSEKTLPFWLAIALITGACKERLSACSSRCWDPVSCSF